MRSAALLSTIAAASTLSLVFGALAIGCSSSSSSSSGTTVHAGDHTSATLAATAHAVQASPTSIDTNTISFEATTETKSFKIGDTIASGQKIPTPYMRKIATISSTSNSVTFTTTPGNLDDLFADADLATTQAFTDGDPESALSIDDGDAGASASTSSGSGSSLTQSNPALGPQLYNFAPQDVEVLPGGAKTFELGNYGSLILAGTAHLNVTQSSFGVSGGVEFAYASSPRHVRLVLHGGIHLRLGAELTVGGEINYDSPERNYGKSYPLGTIWVEAGIIPIPIVMNLEFKHNEEVSLSGDADLKAGITANYALSAGVDYSNGKWSGVFTQTPKVTHDGTFVDPNLTVAVLYDPINTYVNFEIFDVAGPFLGVSPYIGVQKGKTFQSAEANKAEAGKAASSLFDGVYGVEIEYGGEVELFGYNLGELSAILFNAEGTYPVCLKSALTCSAGDVPVIAH